MIKEKKINGKNKIKDKLGWEMVLDGNRNILIILKKRKSSHFIVKL